MQFSNSLEAELVNDFDQESFGNRIEALRAVVMLALREIDALEKSISVDNREVKEADYCLSRKLERLEIDTIRCALIKANGRQRMAAKLLGMKHTTLNSKIKKYDIDWRLPRIGNHLIV